MPLHVEVRGAGPPLVLLHGFTQTGRLWGRFGEAMAQHHTLVAVDLPGHGGSDQVRADLPTTATMVQQAVTATLGEATPEPALLGYSLGARVALHVATGTDLALTRLILIGGTGGLEDAAARQRRRQADEGLAADLEASGDVGGFMARWLSGPMFAGLAGSAQPEERRRNSAAGLASSLRLAGLGTQEPLWDRLAQMTVPVLALAGADDTRFAAHALRLAHGVASGVASLVPGGGHAVHLAQPDLVSRLVGHWLAAPTTG